MVTLNTILLNNKFNASRIVSSDMSLVKMFILYRNDCESMTTKTYPELQQHGFYLLFGLPDRAGRRKFYPGQTSNIYKRIKQHVKQKEFWNIACIFVNSNVEYIKSQVLYLEYLGIKHSLECNTYDLMKNCQIPAEPVLPDELKFGIKNDFNIIKLYLECSGFSIYASLEYILEDIDKSSARNIIKRVSKQLKDTLSNNSTGAEYLYDYEDDSVESIVYKLHKDYEYDASAMILSDGRMYVFNQGFILPPGGTNILRNWQIDKCVKNKTLSEQYYIISDMIFNTCEEAEEFISGSDGNKWQPAISQEFLKKI